MVWVVWGGGWWLIGGDGSRWWLMALDGRILEWEVAHDFWIVGDCLDGVFWAGMV